jgi:hypothetical protein
LEPFDHLHNPVDPGLSVAALRGLPPTTCTLVAARVAIRVMPIMADSLSRLTRRVDIDAGLPQRCDLALRSLVDNEIQRPDDLKPLRSELSRILYMTEDCRSGPRGVSIPRDTSTQLSAELTWSCRALFNSCEVVEHAIQTLHCPHPPDDDLDPWDHVYLGVYFAIHAEACQLILLGRRFDACSHVTLATKFDTELAAAEPQALRNLSIWPTEQPDWAC